VVIIGLQDASHPASYRPLIPGFDYIVREDSRAVGRIYEDRYTLPGLRWFWSITMYVNPKRGITTSGRAPSLDEAIPAMSVAQPF
jgi:hypothetical protein